MITTAPTAAGPREAIEQATREMTASAFREALRNPSSMLAQSLAELGYRPVDINGFWVDEDTDGRPEYERFDFVDEAGARERSLIIFTVYEREAIDVLSSPAYGRGMYAPLLADIRKLNEKKAVYDQAVAVLAAATTGDGAQNTALLQAVSDAKFAVDMQDMHVLAGQLSLDDAAPHAETARYLALVSTDAEGQSITDPNSGKVLVSVFER